jgi:hypothetical protein
MNDPHCVVLLLIKFGAAESRVLGTIDEVKKEFEYSWVHVSEFGSGLT